MYSSLKRWMDLPIGIKPFIKRTGTGTKIFGDIVSVLGYAAGEIVLITDSAGAEVVSGTQLYIDGNVAISVLDNVIFEDMEHPIKNVKTFYRLGKPDIKVVYL